MKSVEQQLSEAQEQSKAQAKEIETYKEAVKKANKAAVQSELDKLVGEAKLPDFAAKRIKQQFAEAEKMDGMKEAVAAEAEYLKQASSGPVKKHNGAADNGDAPEADAKARKLALVETLKSQGISEAEAKGIAGLK